jgi:hypothetical protein
MTKEQVIAWAREAGFDAESDTLTCHKGFVKPLTRFATLVVANLDPKSFMSWQEGYEVGMVAERESCAELCDGLDDGLVDGLAGWQYGEAIRARGEQA